MLRVEDRDRVRLMTLDRPEALNAFNHEMYSACDRALAEAAERPDLAVAVITGAGRAFSAGQDLGEMAELGTSLGPGERPRTDGPGHAFSSFLDTVMTFPKPLVAAVNGIAVGIGVTLLGHCDLVMVADEARLRAPFVSLGVVPEAGSSFTLPAAMGRQAANHFLFSSEWIDAAAAVSSGLALRSVPGARLVVETMDMAVAIAAMPVVSLVETKRLLLATRLDSVRAARAREEEQFARLTGAPANREALAAFLEKRAPDFTNLDVR